MTPPDVIHITVYCRVRMATKMNKYSTLYVICVLSLELEISSTLKFEKPVAETIWKEACSTNSRILNDCNWCRCVNGRYKCDARACNEVDMFGHFNDAIQDINVGMEGHGAWRSNQPPCKPGVHYQRGELLCICTEEGGWPNPVCRDTFRILHPVEIVSNVKTFKDQHCTPEKLYLIGCNVCFCPAEGIPDPKLCTRKACAQNDPVFYNDTPKANDEVGEVYAECTLDKKYKLGCRSCICLKNNRLICSNCTEAGNICSTKETGEPFDMGCNTCQCDGRGLLYCTVKRCLKYHVNPTDVIVEANHKSVSMPFSDVDCIEGTKYKKDCNICYCFRGNDHVKKFSCTQEKCSKPDSLKDCVNGSLYEKNCLICQCGMYNGEKMETCHENPKCKMPTTQELQGLADKSYCEPLQTYKSNCNNCECLPDGKTVRCTAHRCIFNIFTGQFVATDIDSSPVTESISVEIVPVMKDIGHCPKGKSFVIDCNVCVCLSNGDVICTSKDCSKRF